MSSKSLIILMTAIILSFMVIVTAVSYTLEFQKKPVLKETLERREMASLYSLYISSLPETAGRPWHGVETAPITLIAYISPASSSSRFFQKEIFPQLEQEFISTGKVRFMHKNYLTAEDMANKNDNYVFAKSLACISRIKNEEYYDFYFDLFGIASPKEMQVLLERHGIVEDVFMMCLRDSDDRELLNDVSEVDAFGMLGTEPRFYIGILGIGNTVLDGVPSYTRMRRAIRDLQLQLGD